MRAFSDFFESPEDDPLPPHEQNMDFAFLGLAAFFVLLTLVFVRLIERVAS